MDKKKYWFFGSKLNSVLLLVLIILMVFALRYMFQNKEIYFPGSYKNSEEYAHTTALDVGKGNQLNENKNDSKVDLSGWKLIPDQSNNVFYNENWKYEKNSGNSYLFTLPSGNYLNWAYTGSGCTDNLKDRENTDFKYGVSESGCIKGWTVWLGVQDVHEKNTQEDLNSLGDFILKNQNYAEQIIDKNQITWEQDKTTSLFYPQGAKILEPEISYFVFTYKDIIVDIGEYTCDKSKFNFQYGISTEACITKNLHPVLHPYNSPGRELTSDEKIFFGDFILKNQ